MRVHSAPSPGCGTLGTVTLLLFAPEEVAAHPPCHPEPVPCVGRGGAGGCPGARVVPLGTPPQQAQASQVPMIRDEGRPAMGQGCCVGPRGVGGGAGDVLPYGGDMGTSKGPCAGVHWMPQPGHHLTPLHVLRRGSGGRVLGAGNIWAHSHNQVPPTAAAAGPSPLSRATVCFAASLAPIEAFQLRPLQGV